MLLFCRISYRDYSHEFTFFFKKAENLVFYEIHYSEPYAGHPHRSGGNEHVFNGGSRTLYLHCPEEVVSGVFFNFKKRGAMFYEVAGIDYRNCHR